ncbi:putative EXS family protein [Lyophyllum shimeji]|uniref:EXS family protein n=1 Tax=Lyophyllum shimeji TaxID=47721 RepID=A0A9P3PUZ5_LYOSH|nr:putative EXS family protein [Lyophyllum shimeji]
MKFARYLQDTQTPEWKRAYIDYRTLKKRITDIRKAQEGLSSDSPSTEPDDDRDSEASNMEPRAELPSRLPNRFEGDVNVAAISRQSSTPSIDETKFEDSRRGAGSYEMARRDSGMVGNRRGSLATRGCRPSFAPSIKRGLRMRSREEEGRDSATYYEPSDAHEVVPYKDAAFEEKRASGSSESVARDPNVTKSRSMRGPQSSLAYTRSFVSFRKRGMSQASQSGASGSSRPTNPMELLPLKDLLVQLDPTERAFFTALDAQLDKIESFYTAREAEMIARTKVLRMQLEELGDHKKLVQATHSRNPSSWSTALIIGLQDKLGLTQAPKLAARRAERPDTKDGNTDLPWNRASVGLETLGKGKEKEEDAESEIEEDRRSFGRTVGLSSDPEDYLYAKKKLKKAVLEHYRGLEVLHNYRILNLTGFRKALKKFEKTTKIKAQRQYMSEKVEQSGFASDKNVKGMMSEMENLYAARFARGDTKRAATRLRAGFHSKTHHYSVFRSGILLGLALPALVSGLHASFQQSTRDAIPGWDGLLFIYGVMLIPVLFSLVVGANLLVWARARINYVFIFELDTRTRMDYRQYYEIPSILLASLCYAFWLSFLRIGAPHVSPTIWPLVWLGFCGFVMLNPLPLFYKTSRYWLLKNLGKLLISGSRRVEFADFWMGDQLCSLAFSLSNLYLFGSPHWPAAFFLASLPLLVRLVQSVKRYYDSGLVTHLINGGKYGSGIVSNLCFYVWRHQGTTSRGTVFALWLLFNTLYATYASSWDFLMDWSVLNWRARHPFLRQELVYSSSIPLYYIAIVTNVLIRFIWVIYIPTRGPNMFMRAFIGGVFEMLRRWQWNFYRLENEHLGNMDQYRVTREVPLPYSFDDPHVVDADDGDDDDDEALQIAAAGVKARRRVRLRSVGRGRRAKKVG